MGQMRHKKHNRARWSNGDSGRLLVVVGLLLAVSLSRGQQSTAQPVPPMELELKVSEWALQSRTSEPVTVGIPIPSDATGASWALFDGSSEIPLQTTVLPNRTTPWLLLDFQTSVGASQTKTLTLRQQNPTVTVAQPITVNEDSSQITVTTGTLRTQMSKTDFNLFDTVWIDGSNGGSLDGSFANGERIITPALGSNLAVTDVGSGNIFSGRGTPTSGQFTWEDVGPLRRTLRVDGKYIFTSTELVAFTTRFTWYAGQTQVKVEHLIRNSSPTQEKYIKLSSATLNVGTTTTTTRIVKSGQLVWSNVTTSTPASLQLIPPTLSVSTDYAPYATPAVARQRAVVNIDTGGGGSGGLIIGDLSYHGVEAAFDFAPSLASGEKTRRAAVFQDPMTARAADTWYSETGALGYHFSSYQDEKDAYTRWGWTWPTVGNDWSYEHNLPRRPGMEVSWHWVDAANDPESDDLHENLVMFMRTGLPYYLDRARAWSRYLNWEQAFRTDNFTYAGAWDNFWDGPGTVDRPVVQPTLHENDSDYITHDIKYGKFVSDHSWTAGMLEYYYLTGNRDSLLAAIDSAEVCKRHFDWQYLPLHGIGGTMRGAARCMLILLDTWQATDQAHWKTSADHILDLFLQSGRYDPRGFHYNNFCDVPGADLCQRFPNGKGISPFMVGAGSEALYRFYRLTNNPAIRDRLVAMATFLRDNAYHPVTGYGPEELVVDWPTPGAVSHVTTSALRNIPPITTIHAAAASRDFINLQVVAYRLTGTDSFLESAKTAWSRASKGTPPHIFATSSQVGMWANSLQAWTPDTILFPNGGDWTYVSYLFYEAAREDTIAPAAVNDLRSP